jgi:Domain of unknown function (DUF1942)
MKFTKPIITAAVGIGVAMAATASAYSTVGKFGTYERLYDAGGAVVTAWTVDNLKPSTDRIPRVPAARATATIEPVRGTVTPLIPNLNARADNGQNYQALWEAFMPQGISGATIPQGARSTGKIYFDVTGQTPSRVMYNNGVQDLLIWEK